MTRRIQDYLRTTASQGRIVERVGPFVVTITDHDPNTYLNYAIPDHGAEPTAQDAAALIAAFERHDRRPRLEYLPGLAPAVEPVLLAAGFTVEQRLPLMEHQPLADADPSIPEGIELRTPLSDDDFMGLLATQHEVFGNEPPDAEHLAAARRMVGSGGLMCFARDTVTGKPVGGGAATAVDDGFSEVVGVAVRSEYEKRGIGGAITLHLTAAARAADAATVFLTPAGDAQERVYARVGYRRTDSMLFLSKEIA